MKKFICLTILFHCCIVFSQVGINTTTPAAQLEIKSSNQVTPANTDGLLIPKIDAFPATNPTVAQQSMLVYLTTISGVNQPGFYYWDDVTAAWKNVSGIAGWGFTGNAGTVAGTNYIGTSDNVDVSIKANALERIKIISGTGNIGFNTPTPEAQLQITASNQANPSYFDGIIIPKIDIFPITNPTAAQQSMLVYLTTATVFIGIPKPAGFYYWDITTADWKALADSSVLNGWSTTGNNGTIDGTNFIGTIDEAPINFRVKNKKAGRIEGATTFNTFLGYQSGNINTGSYNSGFGFNSLKFNTSGSFNVAFGYQSLLTNSTGSENTAIGYNALLDNTIGMRNVATGLGALQYNTTGTDNVAMGNYALGVNTSGNFNTGIGNGSLGQNTTGILNTAVGLNALNGNTTGNNNIALGYVTLNNNGIGNKNIAIGNEAMYYNTSGNDNVATGNRALFNNTTGFSNVAFGNNALQQNTTGVYNHAFGDGTLINNTTGSGNVAMGTNALASNTTATNSTAIGTGALYSNTTVSELTAIGNNALASNTIGTDNTAVGNKTLLSNTDGASNTAVGSNALRDNVSGNINTAIGYSALQKNIYGSENTAVGYAALPNNTTGYENTAVGTLALRFNTTGYDNAAFGVASMQNNTSGYANIAIGNGALSENRTGNDNIAIGIGASIYNATGNKNISIGNQAMNIANSGSSGNVALGYGALATENNFSSNTDVTNNVAIGRNAGLDFGNRNRCTFVGAYSSAVGDGGVNLNSTMIGYETYADKSFATALGSLAQVQGYNSTAIGANSFVFGDNKLVLGSINGHNDATASTFVGIGTISPVCPLDVRGQNILGINNYNYYFYGYGGDGFANAVPPVSIRAASRIVGSEFNAVSDGRIKTIINRQNPTTALDKLNQLTVTNYSYKDVLTNGNAPKIGFIAQEVEKVLPYTVRKSTNEIPSIMQIPKKFCYDTENQELEITLEKPHGLTDNSTIKFFNDLEPFQECTRVITPNIFSVHYKSGKKTDKLFVYGEIVDDFRSVDYDQIHTLTVAAVQELSTQNNALKNDINTLKAEIEKLKVDNQTIQTLVQDVANLKTATLLTKINQ